MEDRGALSEKGMETVAGDGTKQQNEIDFCFAFKVTGKANSEPGHARR